MQGNEYFERGGKVYIRFQTPDGIVEHEFCKPTTDEGDLVSDPDWHRRHRQNQARHIAEALNLKDAEHRAENPHEYNDVACGPDAPVCGGNYETQAEKFGY